MNLKKTWLGLTLLLTQMSLFVSLPSSADDETRSPTAEPLRLPVERLVKLDGATWFAFDLQGFGELNKVYAAYLSAYEWKASAEEQSRKTEAAYEKLVVLANDKYLEASESLAIMTDSRDRLVKDLEAERKARRAEQVRSDLRLGLGIGGGILGGILAGFLLGFFVQ